MEPSTIFTPECKKSGVIRATEYWAEVTLEFLCSYKKVDEMRFYLNKIDDMNPLEFKNAFGINLNMRVFSLLKQIILNKIDEDDFAGIHFYLFNSYFSSLRMNDTPDFSNQKVIFLVDRKGSYWLQYLTFN